MSIIKPNQYDGYRRFIVFILFFALAGGIFYIFEYNAFVDNRYQVKTLKKNIADIETINTDLKNELYKIIDPAKLEKSDLSKNLVLERRPEYLQVALSLK